MKSILHYNPALPVGSERREKYDSYVFLGLFCGGSESAGWWKKGVSIASFAG